MKKFFFVFVLAATFCASALILLAAKRTTVEKLSSTMVTRTITVGAFSKLDVSRVDVVFTPGPATGKVVLTAPENIADRIDVKVNANKLHIGLDDNTVYNHGSLNAVVKVTAPSLTDIEAGLSSKVTITSDMTVQGSLEIDAVTSASVTAPAVTTTGGCDLESSTSAVISIKKLTVHDKADLEASTSGVINVGTLDAAMADFEASTSAVIQIDNGKAKFAQFEATTSGVVKAAGFVADDATADASTSGSVMANFRNLRNCTTSTGGSISRTGN